MCKSMVMRFQSRLVYINPKRSIHIPDKKRTTYNCSTPRKITRDMLVLFILVQRYVRYCCITHRLQSGVKNAFKKIGHETNGGQIVKSQKISVFIMLSCRINSNNGNHLSRPNCTQTRILCTFIFNFIIRGYLTLASLFLVTSLWITIPYWR